MRSLRCVGIRNNSSRRFVTASLCVALFALCVPMFGQSDAVMVTVSRNVDLSPDEVYFALAVATEPTISLDEVLKASQVLGLTAKNLTSVTLQQYGPSAGQTRLAYAFDLSVPYTSFKDINDKLATARRTMAAETPPMDLQVYGIAVSPSDATREEARQGLLAPLFDDARRRADQLAKAAGVTLGAIVGVSDAWANTPGAPFYAPYGPIGPTTLRNAYTVTVRYAVK